jgi:hypothetical protein
MLQRLHSLQLVLLALALSFTSAIEAITTDPYVNYGKIKRICMLYRRYNHRRMLLLFKRSPDANHTCSIN